MSRSRRELLRQSLAIGVAAGLPQFVTGGSVAQASEAAGGEVLRGPTVDLEIANTKLLINGRNAWATTVNGGVPGPEIRLVEGQDVLLRVTNRLDVSSSIHWHGLLLPTDMDGVPGLSFDGIAPGETFEYRFKTRQTGTYWYHSHSGFQEQTGVYGCIIIEPATPDPYKVDREITVQLSDWTFEDPTRVLAHLKKYGGYYNYQRRTLAKLGSEAKAIGLGAALRDRMNWGRMRMDSTDLADITGMTYTYLINGHSPDDNWTGAFKPGERVRIRLINSGAGTTFDFRIPGLKLTIIEADGQPVVPVEVDELRIAIAETYDMIIEPTEEAYTVYAEPSDRSGFARATLASRPGASAEVPARRLRPQLTMADMGMEMDMEGMDMSTVDTHYGGMDMGAESGGMDMGAESGGMDMGAESGGMDMGGKDSAEPGGDMGGMDMGDKDSAESGGDMGAESGGMDMGDKDSAESGGNMGGMDMGGMDMGDKDAESGGMDMGGMDMGDKDSAESGGMDMGAESGGMDMGAEHADHGAEKLVTKPTMPEPPPPPPTPPPVCREVAPVARHNSDGHGAGNTMTADVARTRVHEPGAGLGKDGWKVLTYSDLRRAQPRSPPPEPDREIVLHLTGNMERYMWSFDGVAYHKDMPPIHLTQGERVRFVLINDTMMTHPIHLHGMFFEFEVGGCERNPLKHTINVQPAERSSFVIDVEEIGLWAFHCHILYHMDTGMFRAVEVTA